MVALATTRRTKLRVYYGRVGKPWIVLQFPVQDWRVALCEAFDMHLRGVLGYRESQALQRRILDAVREL